MTGDYAEPEEEKTLDEEDIDLGNMGGFTKAPLWLHTRYSAVHFVLKTKMEMPPTFFRVRHFVTFLYGNRNIAIV
jgi:hypothetical protein